MFSELLSGYDTVMLRAIGLARKVEINCPVTASRIFPLPKNTENHTRQRNREQS